MSLRVYGAYRESGVQWLGEVPAHWEIKKIGHLSDLIAGFAFPSEGFSFDEDAGIPLVRGDNVSEGYLRWGDKGRYWPHGIAFEDRYLLAENDIVIQMDGSKVGKNWAMVSSNDLPLLLVQRVTRVRVRGALPRFVYLLIANELFVRYVDQAKTDPAVPHITMRNIADYWVPLPPLSEQVSIASFLDRETTKIDALVGEQRLLIRLLEEKRQAVISHAVTKGLNPNTPMKNSGVEWLGDAPHHWLVGPLRRFVKCVQTGRTPKAALPSEEVSDGLPWFTPGDFDGDIRLKPAMKFVSRDTVDSGDASRFPTGAVLVVSIGATLGKVGLPNTPSSANQQINVNRRWIGTPYRHPKGTPLNGEFGR